MTKLANNENVTADIMAKICTALNCKMDDVIDIIFDYIPLIISHKTR